MTCNTNEHWWMDSDTMVRIGPLRNAVTDMLVDDADVTASFDDGDGTHVADFVFSPVEGQEATFLCVLPHGLPMREDRPYTLTIVAAGDGWQLTVKVTRMAAYRRQ